MVDFIPVVIKSFVGSDICFSDGPRRHFSGFVLNVLFSDVGVDCDTSSDDGGLVNSPRLPGGYLISSGRFLDTRKLEVVMPVVRPLLMDTLAEWESTIPYKFFT